MEEVPKKNNNLEELSLLYSKMRSIDKNDESAFENIYFEITKLRLGTMLDIFNLSNIEAYHLKEITRKVVDEHAESRKIIEKAWETWDLRKKGLVSVLNAEGFNLPAGIDLEIITRWLSQLYGIDLMAVNKNLFRIGRDKEIIAPYNQEFKDHIKILREEAHLI